MAHLICFQSEKVINVMSRFKRTASQPYTLITPYTPLAELEEFLKHNIFAIGVCPSASCFCVFIFRQSRTPVASLSWRWQQRTI
jgi:hypothetical protein